MTEPMVTVAAVAGDAVDLESFRAVEAWLGHGMADLAAILDPRVFIIGGGVVEAGELLVGAADPAWANLQIYPLLRLDRHRSSGEPLLGSIHASSAGRFNA